ncbi:MAG: ATP-binding protein [Deltaproteobacteria bacterium]|nr:ATP-binding protein [Deltaproteobacteria bacterium]
MVGRELNILLSRSFFLFGARGVGKTRLLKETFSKEQSTFWIDLLLPSEFDRYLLDPELLIRKVDALERAPEWIVIDEVQKIPKILDVVHHLIEERKLRFALSGSSAKKLRAGGANLLAGRAFVYHLYPFTAAELGEQFNLDEALAFGTLPEISALATPEEKERYLESYALTYLKEEVWNEHLVRALEPFRRFLEVAAQTSGSIVNFAKIARDVGVDEKTVKSYFSILEETLLGFFLDSYHTSLRKTQRRSPKFYLFDLGVIRAFERTLQIPITPRTYGYGRLFEHFVLQEVVRKNVYRRKNFSLYYFQSQANVEVDLVIDRPGEDPVLVEIKSTDRISREDIHCVRTLLRELPKAQGYCFSRDNHIQVLDGVRCLPWDVGLKELGLW